jgi:hypothetical protein
MAGMQASQTSIPQGVCCCPAGYSDSGKDAGRVAAAWALFETQENIVQVNRGAADGGGVGWGQHVFRPLAMMYCLKFGRGNKPYFMPCIGDTV